MNAFRGEFYVFSCIPYPFHKNDITYFVNLYLSSRQNNIAQVRHQDFK